MHTQPTKQTVQGIRNKKFLIKVFSTCYQGSLKIALYKQQTRKEVEYLSQTLMF